MGGDRIRGPWPTIPQAAWVLAEELRVAPGAQA